MKAVFATIAFLISASNAFAFELRGVSLGDSERDVTDAFPSAYCRPLEWKSSAADRRCDDGKSSFAGVAARVTFYLKGGRVQAFDVRFDARERDRVAAFLRSHKGKPAEERTETIARRSKEERRIYRATWREGNDKAVLTVRLGTRFGLLEASRGDFAQKIYEVK
jgi:hypothetical protein